MRLLQHWLLLLLCGSCAASQHDPASPKVEALLEEGLLGGTDPDRIEDGFAALPTIQGGEKASMLYYEIGGNTAMHNLTAMAIIPEIWQRLPEWQLDFHDEASKDPNNFFRVNADDCIIDGSTDDLIWQRNGERIEGQFSLNNQLFTAQCLFRGRYFAGRWRLIEISLAPRPGSSYPPLPIYHCQLFTDSCLAFAPAILEAIGETDIEKLRDKHRRGEDITPFLLRSPLSLALWTKLQKSPAGYDLRVDFPSLQINSTGVLCQEAELQALRQVGRGENGSSVVEAKFKNTSYRGRLLFLISSTGKLLGVRVPRTQTSDWATALPLIDLAAPKSTSP